MKLSIPVAIRLLGGDSAGKEGHTAKAECSGRSRGQLQVMGQEGDPMIVSRRPIPRQDIGNPVWASVPMMEIRARPLLIVVDQSRWSALRVVGDRPRRSG